MSFLKQFFFTEVNPIIDMVARKEPVSVKHLKNLSHNNKDYKLDTQYSLAGISKFIYSILRLNWYPVICGIFCSVLRVLFSLSIPILTRQLLLLITSSHSVEGNFQRGILYAVLLSVATILSGIITNQCFYWDFMAFQAHQRVLDTFIYKKMLRLSPGSINQLQPSDMVNHVSNDNKLIANLGYLVDDAFYAISLFVGVTVLLFRYIGIATIIALITLIIVTPVVGLLVSRLEKYDSHRSELRAKRLGLIAQVVEGIRTAKLYHFTDKIERDILEVRKNEVTQFIKWGMRSAIAVAIFSSISTLVCLVTFGTRIVLGQSLEASVLFPVLALLMMLQLPFVQIPDIISSAISVKVAAKRVMKYLSMEEQEGSLTDCQLSDQNKALGVALKDVSYSIDGKTLLHNINIDIKKGEMIAVVGCVGSGKSTLLKTLLGADARTEGSVRWDGLNENELPRIGYVPQEAFIINGSFKENILLNLKPEKEEALLKHVIHTVRLVPDLENLPGGLSYEVCHRGVNLSGGQKQRLSLARAMAFQPGIAILDDSFSAVDKSTDEQIFDRLLLKEWGNITRVVATNRLNHLDKYDRIIFLQDGRIQAIGTLKQLLIDKEFVAFYSKSKEDPVISKEKKDSVPMLFESSDNEALQMTDTEDRQIGHVDAKVYKSYIKTLGGKNHFSANFTVYLRLMLSVVLCILLPMLQNLWLVAWSNPSALTGNGLLKNLANNQMSGLAVYALIGVFALISVFAERAIWNRQIAVSSKVLHENAVRGLFHAPIRFFDSMPAGVIINRFSRDIAVLENDLRWMFENMVRYSFDVIANLTLILFVAPWLIFGIVPVLILYWLLQRRFSNASREVKRIAQITGSPVLGQVTETFEGLTNINTYHSSNYFYTKYLEKHKEFQKSARAHELIDRWFSVRIPLLSGMISLLSSVSIFTAAYQSNITEGLAGVILTYLINLWTLFNWSARTFAMVEGNLTSVERLAYLSELPNECNEFNQTVKDKEPIAVETLKGSLEFDSVSVRYDKKLPDVLKQVSFKISAGEKIGIIGRTGSGKSTIMQSIVGMTYLSGGNIYIDNILLNHFSLEFIRDIISVIPQEPYLFDGSLRMNLDPVGNFDDSEIVKAVKQLGLQDFLNSLPDGLDTEIKSKNDGLSQGQKQLLCFARIVLKQPKIIIMDEATSNIDVKTEHEIQNQINRLFSNTTLLIIAHRTSTLKDCDKIICLADGRISKIINKQNIEKIKEM